MSSFIDKKITNKDLDKFGIDHYSFINQIFGDESLRGWIMYLYPNPKYILEVENANNNFDSGSEHHYVLNKITKEKICSVDTLEIQNTKTNKNDTLCQSYSLLYYFGLIDDRIKNTFDFNNQDDMKNIQMKMIKMYKDIINNEPIIGKLKKITKINKGYEEYTNIKDILKPDKFYYSKWFDFSTEKDPKDYNCDIKNKRCKSLEITMNNDVDELLRKINETLDQWEKYGYQYFIREGKITCNRKTCIKRKTELEKLTEITQSTNTQSTITQSPITQSTNTQSPITQSTNKQSLFKRTRRYGGKKNKKQNKTKQKTNKQYKNYYPK